MTTKMIWRVEHGRFTREHLNAAYPDWRMSPEKGIRIVMTEKPRTFMDELKFAAVRTMIITGFRAGEAALLPADWKRERTYVDAKGRPAGAAGGISTSLMLRHFAEKQQTEESDSRILRENTQPVPDMFSQLLTETLDRVVQITQPLRDTLKLQCEIGRILPWYQESDIVPFTELYPRITGNPFWLIVDDRSFLERYRQTFAPDVLHELHQHQLQVNPRGTGKFNMALYMFGNRLMKQMHQGETALRFRNAAGTTSCMQWSAALATGAFAGRGVAGRIRRRRGSAAARDAGGQRRHAGELAAAGAHAVPAGREHPAGPVGRRPGTHLRAAGSRARARLYFGGRPADARLRGRTLGADALPLHGLAGFSRALVRARRSARRRSSPSIARIVCRRNFCASTTAWRRAAIPAISSRRPSPTCRRSRSSTSPRSGRSMSACAGMCGECSRRAWSGCRARWCGRRVGS